MASRPRRNCSKYSRFSLDGTAGVTPAYTSLILDFGIVRLDKRAWRMRNIEYLASIMYDNTVAGRFSTSTSSQFNGCQWVIRPANQTFLFDMFGQFMDYAGGSTTYAANIYNSTSISSAADLKNAGSTSMPADIDTSARNNSFNTNEIQQPANNSGLPGIQSALFFPPVIGAFAFVRNYFSSPTYLGTNSELYTSVSTEIDVPAGYDYLLCYVAQCSQMGASQVNAIEFMGNIRFTLEQAQ